MLFSFGRRLEVVDDGALFLVLIGVIATVSSVATLDPNCVPVMLYNLSLTGMFVLAAFRLRDRDISY